MKDFLKNSLKFITIFVCLIVLFNALMYLSCSIPSKWVENNVKESADIILEQGYFLKRGFFAVAQNYTDSVQINEVYSVDSKDPIKSYLLVRKNYKEGQTKVELPDEQGELASYSENNFDEDGNPQRDTTIVNEIASYKVSTDYKTVEELYNFVNGKVEISQSYSRYYHGYLVILRPLFVFFNVTGVRWFMTIVMFLLFFAVWHLLSKKLNKRFSIIFVSLLVSYGLFSISQSLEQASLFLVILISTLILLKNIESYDINKLYLHVFITACFTNFMDFFTTPVLSLCIPLLIFYIYNIENAKPVVETKEIKKAFFDIFKVGLVWSLGFVLTWLSKFIIAAAFDYMESFSSGINQMLYRTVGEVPNYDYVLNVVFVPFVIKTTLLSCAICTIACMIVEKISFKLPNKEALKKYISLIFIALIPIAWMIITRNHTLFHFDLFTYRNLSIILMVVFYMITNEKTIKKVRKNK